MLEHTKGGQAGDNSVIREGEGYRDGGAEAVIYQYGRDRENLERETKPGSAAFQPGDMRQGGRRGRVGLSEWKQEADTQREGVLCRKSIWALEEGGSRS